MTKQEKIRTDAVKLCEDFGLGWNEATYLIDYLFILLANRGVAIKVDRELPKVDDAYKDFGGNDSIWETSQQDMLKAGYSAWEPLIETPQCECGLFYKKINPNQKCPRCKK